MGGVLKFLGLAMLLVAVSCGGSNSMRPDGAGPAGIDGGASGGVAISRTYTTAPNPRNVDILFLVDDSSSMAAAQATLRESLGRFASALRALPGGLPNLHIAVVSSDMGAGDGSISGCSGTGKSGVFQYLPRGTCTSTGLQAGARFISDVGGTKNYTGNLEDVLGCMSALGESGCGFEHQFAAITRALGADGRGGPPAENAGFLRPDAYLAIIMLTNEDDCSEADGVPLFDTSQNLTLASQLGPPSNFRCNEFGHLCDSGAPSRNAPNGMVTDTRSYQNCVSAEGSGLLKTVGDAAGQIKALKADPLGQIIVASIQGPATPYQVHWKAPNTTDVAPWPEVTHVCTAANASFADPGVRTAELVAQFGDNGLLSSICDADFGTALERVAARIGMALNGACITEAIADDPTRAGYQPQCSAQMWVGVTTGASRASRLAPTVAGPRRAGRYRRTARAASDRKSCSPPVQHRRRLRATNAPFAPPASWARVAATRHRSAATRDQTPIFGETCHSRRQRRRRPGRRQHHHQPCTGVRGAGLPATRRRQGPPRHRSPLHVQLYDERRLRRRHSRRQVRSERPPLQERLRLHGSNDGRPILLPADVRLPRLRHRASGADSRPRRPACPAVAATCQNVR